MMHNLEERELAMLRDIEFALVQEYEANQDLSDLKVAHAMDHAKVAVKQAYGFAQKQTVSDAEDIQGIITQCREVGKKWIDANEEVDAREFCRLLDKVKRSINRHATQGLRGYYEFVQNYV